CVWAQGDRVAGLCICAAPGGAPNSYTAMVDGQTVCGGGPGQDFQWVRWSRGRARGRRSRRGGVWLSVFGWERQPVRVSVGRLLAERWQQTGGGWGCHDGSVQEYTHELRYAPERPGGSASARL